MSCIENRSGLSTASDAEPSALLVNRSRLQLKRELANLPYQEQLERVKPPEEKSRVDQPVQLSTGTGPQVGEAVQMDRYPRYDELFADGLLDVTLVIGYDETDFGPGIDSAHIVEQRQVVAGLHERGYEADDERAFELFEAAGREPPTEFYSALFVRENVATVQGQPVHCVIRLVFSNEQGDNGAVHQPAVVEGLDGSDVFMYGGHARMGSGPDVDAIFEVEVDWTGDPDNGDLGQYHYTDYHVLLEDLLPSTDEPEDHQREAIQRFQELEAEGRVVIIPRLEGNVVINTAENPYPNHLGSYLLYRTLEGHQSRLRDLIADDHYRVWFFNGCTTRMYYDTLRSYAEGNPAFDDENLDLFGTRRRGGFRDVAQELLAFLDGLVGQNSSSVILQRLRVADSTEDLEGYEGRLHNRQGFGDNPRENPVEP